MFPKVSIVVVNYNGEQWLRKCFHTIAAQKYRGSLQIILVDNNSSDMSREFAKKKYKNAVVVNSGGNLGYSGGANFGCRYAKGEYVALMANDMFFPQDWIQKMVDFMEKDKDLAASTAIMVNGEDVSLSEGELLNASPVLVGRADTKGTGETVVPWGGACIFRRNLFPQPFDSEYFLYGEDIYLGLMSWLRGYKVKSNPVKVAHLGSVTVGFFSRTQVYYNERNRLANLLVFFKFKTLLMLAPLIVSDAALKLLYFLKAKRADLAKAEISALSWNLKDLKKNLRKRHYVQRQRKVADYKIFEVLCENMYGEGRVKNILNLPAIGYFRFLKCLWRLFKI